MTKAIQRIAALASGGGSNVQAIVDHLQRLGARRSGDVVLVVSDRKDSLALSRARDRGIAALHVPRGEGTAVDALLREHAIDVVVLAGYLRLVPESVTRRYRGRILNVHPSLLPAFGGHGMYGIRVHQAAIAAGVRVSGVTVHFVDEEYDHGPIAAQWPVPVLADDAAEQLAARVLRVEHLLYPRVVDAVCSGGMRLDHDDRVHGTFDALEPSSAFTLLPREDSSLAFEMESALWA